VTLTKTKLTELRRIRDGATPGKWRYSMLGLRSDKLNCVDEPTHVASQFIQRDGDYCAAFDPATTGELLDALEKCREALEFYSKETGHFVAMKALREVFGEGGNT
jgi:hypothetical protein